MRRYYMIFTTGDHRFILKGILKRLNSTVWSFELKRDLEILFTNPDSTIPLNIRLFNEKDDVYFKDANANCGLVQENLPNCYIAVTNEEVPCHRIWLINYGQNAKIKGFFGNLMPDLKENEALLEGVFTVPSFRGMNIMPATVSRILEKAKDMDVRWVIAFVEVNNMPSLRGFKRAGFSPHMLREEKWFLFYRSIRYIMIPSDVLDMYHEYTEEKTTIKEVYSHAYA